MDAARLCSVTLQKRGVLLASGNSLRSRKFHLGIVHVCVIVVAGCHRADGARQQRFECWLMQAAGDSPGRWHGGWPLQPASAASYTDWL